MGGGGVIFNEHLFRYFEIRHKGKMYFPFINPLDSTPIHLPYKLAACETLLSLLHPIEVWVAPISLHIGTSPILKMIERDEGSEETLLEEFQFHTIY